MGRWWWYGQKGERVDQMRKGGNVPFWERAQPGFSVVPKAVALVVPRISRAEQVRVVRVSNVIYQKWYLIRLIYISGFLSN